MIFIKLLISCFFFYYLNGKKNKPKFMLKLEKKVASCKVKNIIFLLYYISKICFAGRFQITCRNKFSKLTYNFHSDFLKSTLIPLNKLCFLFKGAFFLEILKFLIELL